MRATVVNPEASHTAIGPEASHRACENWIHEPIYTRVSFHMFLANPNRNPLLPCEFKWKSPKTTLVTRWRRTRGATFANNETFNIAVGIEATIRYTICQSLRARVPLHMSTAIALVTPGRSWRGEPVANPGASQTLNALCTHWHLLTSYIRYRHINI